MKRALGLSTAHDNYKEAIKIAGSFGNLVDIAKATPEQGRTGAMKHALGLSTATTTTKRPSRSRAALPISSTPPKPRQSKIAPGQ